MARTFAQLREDEPLEDVTLAYFAQAWRHLSVGAIRMGMAGEEYLNEYDGITHGWPERLLKGNCKKFLMFSIERLR